MTMPRLSLTGVITLACASWALFLAVEAKCYGQPGLTLRGGSLSLMGLPYMARPWGKGKLNDPFAAPGYVFEAKGMAAYLDSNNIRWKNKSVITASSIAGIDPPNWPEVIKSEKQTPRQCEQECVNFDPCQIKVVKIVPPLTPGTSGLYTNTYNATGHFVKTRLLGHAPTGSPPDSTPDSTAVTGGHLLDTPYCSADYYDGRTKRMVRPSKCVAWVYSNGGGCSLRYSYNLSSAWEIKWTREPGVNGKVVQTPPSGGSLTTATSKPPCPNDLCKWQRDNFWWSNLSAPYSLNPGTNTVGTLVGDGQLCYPSVGSGSTSSSATTTKAPTPAAGTGSSASTSTITSAAGAGEVRWLYKDVSAAP